MTKVTAPVGLIRINPFGAKVPVTSFSTTCNAGAAKTVSVLAPVSAKPSSKPVPCRKARRDIAVSSAICSLRISSSMISNSRSVLDRSADALIGAASADISRHGGVDVVIRRLRRVLQERRRRHDLAGLAVAALHHLQLLPRLLQGCALRSLSDRLDRGDRALADAVDRGDTGPRRRAVDMHGAGAAQRLAATELGPGHAQHVAQHPEQRGVAVDIDLMGCAVNLQHEGHGCLSVAAADSRPSRTGRPAAFISWSVSLRDERK